MGKLDQLFSKFSEDEFKEYDEGYAEGKKWVDETIKEIHNKLQNEKPDYIDGYWDAITDHLYFV